MMVHLVTYMFTCAQMAQIQRLGVVFFLSFFYIFTSLSLYLLCCMYLSF